MYRVQYDDVKIQVKELSVALGMAVGVYTQGINVDVVSNLTGERIAIFAVDECPYICQSVRYCL